MRAILLSSLLWAAPVAAQAPAVLDLEGLIGLVAEPWRDGAGFETALDALMPRLDMRRDTVPDGPTDPFAWVRDAEFAAIPGLVPVGGYILCTRIGLATRDALVEADGVSSRARYELYRRYLVESDLMEAWPETAVARLSCHVTWADTRAVAALPQTRVRDALMAHFDEQHDTMPAGQGAFYGADGYRLEGRVGRADTVVLLDRAEVVLTQRHQAIRVRSFLLNGGM